MPAAFTQKQIKAITSLIRTWPTDQKLTWDGICSASADVLGHTPTRQSLSARAIIVNAYKTKKAEIISNKSRTASLVLPKSLKSAAEQIARLQQENLTLKAELQFLAEAWQTIIHNAVSHDVKKEDFLRPLRHNDRQEK
jgi:hypothetical protein